MWGGMGRRDGEGWLGGGGMVWGRRDGVGKEG